MNAINSKKFKELMEKENENLEIIDVREESEFKTIRIKNSKLIPMGEVMDNLDKIDWEKKVILVCRSGGRSGYVGEMLNSLGKETVNLDGGISGLELDGYDCLEK